MQPSVLGLHHVTAIIGKPEPAIEFYTKVLGLRMVKLTVNYDDPGTYHLYFGDRLGRPGTVITFFPWPAAPRGRGGVGQVLSTAYAVPVDSIAFWRSHLEAHAVDAQELTRMGERVIAMRDPDGLEVELVASASLPDVQPWDQSPVDLHHAIHGFHSVSLAVAEHDQTRRLIEGPFQGREVGSEGERCRLEVGAGSAGTRVDLCAMHDAERGEMGPGVVHHVAWRVQDNASQDTLREQLVSEGYRVTSLKDRTYFRSIYFREPGGVIFEIATDGPGMTVDEDESTLGSQLVLPAFLADRRDEIVERLPPLELS